MKKIFICLLCCFLVSTTLTINSFAYNNSSKTNNFSDTEIEFVSEENNNFLINYLESFSNSDEKVYIFRNGEKISSNKQSEIESMIKNSDYTNLKKYLIENNISIGYTEKTIDKGNLLSSAATLSETTNMTPYAIPSESGSYTKRFYEIAAGKVNGKITSITKEWTTVLTGKFTMDNTGKIIYTNGATIHIESANFGSAFAPFLENVYASASYRYPNTLICNGGYHLKSTILIPIGNFGVNFTMDFGYVYRNFEQNV